MELTLHKLSEGGFIITSDEKIKDGDLLFNLKAKTPELFVKDFKYDSNDVWYKKVIAQQSQIDFSALSEEEQKEIGWFNTWDIAKNYVKTLGILGSDIDNVTSENLIVWGFQKALELLSDRKFTLEDVKKAVDIALNSSYVSTQHFSGHSTVKHNFTSDEITQSLSQPKSWKVELEMEYDLESIDSSKQVMKPKFINDKVKIFKIIANG